MAIVLAWALLYVILGKLFSPATQFMPRPATLPLISQLEKLLPGHNEVVREAVLDLPDVLACYRGGEAYGTTGPLRLHGESSPAFGVFCAGRLLPGDTVTRIAVRTTKLMDKPLSFQVALADFGSNGWYLTAPVADDSRQEVEIPWKGSMLSPSGWVYVAVYSDGGSLKLEHLQLQLELTNGPAASFEWDIPPADVKGFPITFPARAVDCNGRLDVAFDAGWSLWANGPGGNCEVGASFKEGLSSPCMVFDEVGKYEVGFRCPALGMELEPAVLKIYETRLPIYSINFGPKTQASLKADPLGEDYREVGLSIDGGTQFPAEMRYRGQWIRQRDKKSIKLKLTGGEEYLDSELGYGRNVFNLISMYGEVSLLREKLSYDLLAEAGVPSPRAKFIHLRVNGVYQGVYMDVENPRRSWLRQMGIDDGGPLYKASLNAGLSVMDSPGDYSGPFEKKLRGGEPYDDLAMICRKLADIEKSSPENALEMLGEIFDLPELTRYLAVMRVIAAGDNWNHNHYLYFDEFGSGKWMVFPWDLDGSWGLFNALGPDPDGSGPQIVANAPLEQEAFQSSLTRIYFNSPALMELYWEDVGWVLENQFTEKRMNHQINGLVELIRGDALADTRKQVTNEQWLAQVEKLRTFVRERRGFLCGEMRKAREKTSNPEDGKNG